MIIDRSQRLRQRQASFRVGTGHQTEA